MIDSNDDDDFPDSDDIETEALDSRFNQAADHIQNIHSSCMANDLLELYGLFKQATVGKCNTTKPGIFNMQARAKWTAWNNLDDMTMAKAKLLYIEKVQKIDPAWQIVQQQSDGGAAAAANVKSSNSWVVHSVEMIPFDLLEPKPDHEKTAFDYIREGNIERFRQTIEIGGEQLLSCIDEHGMGLIHWAADRNATPMLQCLIEAGVDVNLRDIDRQTALHYAACCGHEESVRLLLNSNADPTCKDGEGKTSAQLAEQPEIIMLFEKHDENNKKY